MCVHFYRRVHRSPWLWLALVGLCLGRGAVSAAELKQATFIPQWEPQAQFAGYYMALEKGLYRRHGIELVILRGGAASPSATFVQEGKADFGMLFLSSAIALRAGGQGTPLVNLAQIVRKSSLVLVSKKSSGIRSPADFAGKKISAWPNFQVQPLALFKQFNVKPRIVPQSATVDLFLRGGVDAASAMMYNEYHSLASHRG